MNKCQTKSINHSKLSIKMQALILRKQRSGWGRGGVGAGSKWVQSGRGGVEATTLLATSLFKKSVLRSRSLGRLVMTRYDQSRLARNRD